MSQQADRSRSNKKERRALELTPGLATIDCQTCPVRGLRCGSCMVPVVAQAWLQDTGGSPEPASDLPGEQVELTDEEWEAVDVFVQAGMLSLLDAAQATAYRDVDAGSPRLYQVG